MKKWAIEMMYQLFGIAYFVAVFLTFIWVYK